MFRPREKMRWFDWAMCAAISIFVWIGLALCLAGAKDLWFSLVSVRWPVVAGEVASPYRFAYSVNGRSYITSRLNFGQDDCSDDISSADLTRLRYPPERPVTVAYQPGNPANAVVHPGFHAAVLALPAAGLAFGLPGVMFILLYLGFAKGLPLVKAGFRLFASIFILIGIALLIPGLRNVWLAYDSRTWRVAGGLVLTPKDPSPEAEPGPPDPDAYHSISGHTIYRYQVAGTTYYHDNIRFGVDPDSPPAPGSKVSVYYHPARPDRPVLVPGLSNDAWWLPGAGLVFLLFGLAAWLFIAPRIAAIP